MKRHSIPNPHRQDGSMLLEALISILIFSMGILAIVGMQAASIKQASDAKYRTDANMLINQYIGQMWAEHASPTFQADFAEGGARYNAWVGDPSTPGTVESELPGAASNSPSVTINRTTTTIGSVTSTTSQAQITVRWQLPGESVAHQHVTLVQIGNCPNGVPAQCAP